MKTLYVSSSPTTHYIIVSLSSPFLSLVPVCAELLIYQDEIQ